MGTIPGRETATCDDAADANLVTEIGPNTDTKVEAVLEICVPSEHLDEFQALLAGFLGGCEVVFDDDDRNEDEGVDPEDLDDDWE